jgi:hypothetical protein
LPPESQTEGQSFAMYSPKALTDLFFKYYTLFSRCKPSVQSYNLYLQSFIHNGLIPYIHPFCFVLFVFFFFFSGEEQQALAGQLVSIMPILMCNKLLLSIFVGGFVVSCDTQSIFEFLITN